ncbi:hypothetical protein [Amycolatopsis sp. cmx-4-68]|uniref:hypothetical protein n=1 Tax=Amycolatopsis sp. cmx-4-68 TaxID=2790938 RepID=UPI00397D8A65
MESSPDELYDEYPVGWVLTYRRRRTPGPPSGGFAAGVVLGSPVRDPHTGLDTIPLASVEDGPGAPPVWVPDRDVIGIQPRRPPDDGDRSGTG